MQFEDILNSRHQNYRRTGLIRGQSKAQHCNSTRFAAIVRCTFLWPVLSYLKMHSLLAEASFPKKAEASASSEKMPDIINAVILKKIIDKAYFNVSLNISVTCSIWRYQCQSLLHVCETLLLVQKKLKVFKQKKGWEINHGEE